MMGTRISRYAAAALLAAGVATVGALLDTTSVQPASAQEIAELKEQLNNGLRVQRPEDRAYIDRVVRMVDQGRLPLELVKGTFQWAREKKYRNQFQYFKRALEIRSAEIGVKIE